MLLYKFLVCLVKKHLFIPLQSHGSRYQLCLRCGKLALEAPADAEPVANSEVASV